MTPLDLDAIGRRENVMRLMVAQCRPIWGHNHSGELLELCDDNKGLISEVEALRLELIKKQSVITAIDGEWKKEAEEAVALRAKLEKALKLLHEVHDISVEDFDKALAELEDKKEPDLNQFGVNPTIE